MNQTTTHFELQIPLGQSIVTFIVTDQIRHKNETCTSACHNHFGYELQYIQEGSCRMIANGKEYTANPGDIFIVPPYEYHAHLNQAGERLLKYCICFDIQPANEHSGSFDLPQALSHLEACHMVHDFTGIGVILMEKVVTEMAQKKAGYLLNIRSILTTISIDFFRFFLPELPCDPLESQTMNLEKRRHLIEEFFYFHYMNDVTADDLAIALNLSQRQTCRMLNHLFGMSFRKKMLETRLEIAKLLLKSTDDKISVISIQSGFHSQNHFYPSFREATGMTPEQYRKS